MFLLYTGLRKGEALALTYSDIDRENKRIKVTKSAHQLRHGYATLLLEAELDAKDRQYLLGHTDVALTQNIYTEVSSKRRKAVAEKINSYLQ